VSLSASTKGETAFKEPDWRRLSREWVEVGHVSWLCYFIFLQQLDSLYSAQWVIDGKQVMVRKEMSITHFKKFTRQSIECLNKTTQISVNMANNPHKIRTEHHN
jgi:hypothetical protein